MNMGGFQRYLFLKIFPGCIRSIKIIRFRFRTFCKYQELDIKNTLLIHILELISGFILFEFLNKYTGTYAQFKMIDLRLVFIVFMGSLYGINYGISAAALETCSLIAAYRQENVNIYTLFYEASNWIPFIFILPQVLSVVI